MFDNLFCNNSDNKSKAIFDLELNQLDRFANILFIIGAIVALQSTDITEQSIILGQIQPLSTQEESAFTYEIAKLLALANWTYLAAGILFLNTAYARLEEDEASISQNASLSSKERLLGRKIVVTGNIFKIIGYFLSATGNEIIADSTQVEADSL